MNKKNRNVLITGGAGFIGSHLVRQTLKDGNQIMCLDDLSTGTFSNLSEVCQEKHFTFRNCNINVPWRRDVDQIFHFACPASPYRYSSNPAGTVMTAVVGTLNAVEEARRNRCRMLFASTSEIYGDPSVHPQREDYWGNVDPVGKRSCYAEGKRAGEAICRAYAEEHSVDVRIARIFNVYGPRMLADDGRVVSNFIVQALRKQPLTIFGDGYQTRSFCYVDDIVEGIVRLMNSDSPRSKPMNLGNPDEIAILNLAELIISLTGTTSSISFSPRPDDEPQRRCPDISAAQSVLEWTPMTSLKVGLAKTIDYFDRVLAQRNSQETLL